MKLYEIPNGSKLLMGGREILFHHVDGAYSLCTAVEDGKTMHIYAYSEWDKKGDYYEFVRIGGEFTVSRKIRKKVDLEKR